MQDTRQNILHAATKLFSEKGIYQTSLGDIAGEVGISKGTLFYYYRSKNDLLYEILERSIDELASFLREILEEAGNGGIRKNVFMLIFKKLLKYDFLMKINFYLLQEALLGNEVILKKFDLCNSPIRATCPQYRRSCMT